MANKKVYILLTRFPDAGSRAIEFISGFYYTHASIGLEEDMNTFYSFVCKGFIVEKITRYVRPDREPYPCQLYELNVSDTVYHSIRDLLLRYTENPCDFRYTRLGIALTLLHIPYKRKNAYFCSHFVADVLEQGNAVCLYKDSTKYLPGDLRKLPGMRLNYQGNMQSMLQHFGILPCPA